MKLLNLKEIDMHIGKRDHDRADARHEGDDTDIDGNREKGRDRIGQRDHPENQEQDAVEQQQPPAFEYRFHNTKAFWFVFPNIVFLQ